MRTGTDGQPNTKNGDDCESFPQSDDKKITLEIEKKKTFAIAGYAVWCAMGNWKDLMMQSWLDAAINL